MIGLPRVFRLNVPTHNRRIPDLSPGRSVPKIIHQTFRARPWPIGIEENIENTRKLSPDWDYRFYDDTQVETFVLENYGEEILSVFGSINPAYGAARADLFRYLVMYKVGGIYLDVKSKSTLPLSARVRENGPYLLGQWANSSGDRFERWGLHPELAEISGGEFQQWFIVSPPGHPFIKATLEATLRNITRYCDAVHGTGARAVVRVTGPIAYTLAIAPLMDSNDYQIIDAHKELGLLYSMYDEDGSQKHISHFTNHYAALTLPLVNRGIPGRTLSKAIRLIRNCAGLLTSTAGVCRIR